MYKMIKRTKPCHCRYKPHTPHDMSLFVVYLYRVSFDNDQQWSCYLMISNRFVHIKGGKSDNFWLKREKDMIPTTSTHCENRRMERTEGEDGRTLSAWRRFAGRGSRFGEFYLIDSPPFFLSLWKMHPFLTLFSFLSKKHVLAMFYQLF